MQSAFEFAAPRDPSVHRSRRNPQSRAAHERVHATKRLVYQRLWAWIAARGAEGSTSLELCQHLDHPTAGRKYRPNELSGRLSEMRFGHAGEGFQLYDSGRRRGGAAILVSHKKWTNGSAECAK